MGSLLTVLLCAAIAVSGSVEDDRAAAVRLAQATLARTLGVTEERVRLEDIRPVEWPDAALGCPGKGQAYTQGLVPGYAVRMNVDDSSHRVHVGGGRGVVCDRGTAPEAPKYLQVAAQLQELARRDLATRLTVDAKAVKVMRLRPATWPDASLGCPEPNRTYKKIETRGFLIELRQSEKTYVYHSDRQRVVLCPGR
jgi:hypothetical protein